VANAVAHVPEEVAVDVVGDSLPDFYSALVGTTEVDPWRMRATTTSSLACERLLKSRVAVIPVVLGVVVPGS